jgi:hypothetical protein
LSMCCYLQMLVVQISLQPHCKSHEWTSLSSSTLLLDHATRY